MGGAGSQQSAGRQVAGAGDPDEKPWFFLASCPDDQSRDAIEIVNRYGGFHCLADDSPEDELGNADVSDAQHMAAWRGRVETQFSTLKRMSPKDRKVIGVAVAGFGRINQEREFLGQLSRRKGFEQFELKQCGDAADVERWLKSEGYQQEVNLSQNAGCGGDLMSTIACGSRAGAGAGAMRALGPGDRPAPYDSHAGTQAGDVTATDAAKVGLWASLFGSTAIAEASAKERMLSDVGLAVRAVRELNKDSPIPELKAGGEKLEAAIGEAQSAGVVAEDLEDAIQRRSELAVFADDAERAQSKFAWLCFCCSTGSKTQVDELQTHESVTDSPNQQHHALASYKESSECLPNGTKVLYYSSSWNGWVPAVVQGFIKAEGTYDLDVRRHAKLENISPPPHVKLHESWPIGCLVDYQSDSAGGQFIPAVVQGFTEAVGAGDGTYDLDVKRRAACSRIRPRLS